MESVIRDHLSFISPDTFFAIIPFSIKIKSEIKISQVIRKERFIFYSFFNNTKTKWKYEIAMTDDIIIEKLELNNIFLIFRYLNDTNFVRLETHKCMLTWDDRSILIHKYYPTDDIFINYSNIILIGCIILYLYSIISRYLL